ncbi:hypothetical protein [Larsenimonas suaedae]|uniref:DUF4148 domain-containing protein n=1 Tax=Larsenimonas suaedae TaxID=1851019 RepID=A0ABU1GRD8_9GAMM|nr:hypothetical protein [Larsenimonas suaedae]MCM2972611.1 hypothetical protein [Larsenimonas suaedae]MDR5894593.1 hypothetical protein [Larsenimonas suaedae]
MKLRHTLAALTAAVALAPLAANASVLTETSKDIYSEPLAAPTSTVTHIDQPVDSHGGSVSMAQARSYMNAHAQKTHFDGQGSDVPNVGHRADW